MAIQTAIQVHAYGLFTDAGPCAGTFSGQLWVLLLIVFGFIFYRIWHYFPIVFKAIFIVLGFSITFWIIF